MKEPLSKAGLARLTRRRAAVVLTGEHLGYQPELGACSGGWDCARSSAARNGDDGGGWPRAESCIFIGVVAAGRGGDVFVAEAACGA